MYGLLEPVLRGCLAKCYILALSCCILLKVKQRNKQRRLQTCPLNPTLRTKTNKILFKIFVPGVLSKYQDLIIFLAIRDLLFFFHYLKHQWTNVV